MIHRNNHNHLRTSYVEHGILCAFNAQFYLAISTATLIYTFFSKLDLALVMLGLPRHQLLGQIPDQRVHLLISHS